MYKKTLSALIGLAGAVGNNGKTEHTDTIVRQALLRMHEEDWSERIHAEKFLVSPSCKICPSPCGNTSDYPMDKFDVRSDEQWELMEQVMHELQRIASEGENVLPEIVYRAIAYIGYDLENETYQRLLEEMKLW